MLDKIVIWTDSCAFVGGSTENKSSFEYIEIYLLLLIIEFFKEACDFFSENMCRIEIFAEGG